MKILLLNGSPKKEDSRTLELVGSFLEGLDDNPNYPEIELMKIHMIDMNIGDCMGCFHCWDDPNVPKCI